MTFFQIETEINASADKTYYICEGVSMYVPGERMKETLRAIASESAPAAPFSWSISTVAGMKC